VNSAFNRLVLEALTSILESPVFERLGNASMFLKRAVSKKWGDPSNQAMAAFLHNGLVGEAPLQAGAATSLMARLIRHSSLSPARARTSVANRTLELSSAATKRTSALIRSNIRIEYCTSVPNSNRKSNLLEFPYEHNRKYPGSLD